MADWLSYGFPTGGSPGESTWGGDSSFLLIVGQGAEDVQGIIDAAGTAMEEQGGPAFLNPLFLSNCLTQQTPSCAIGAPCEKIDGPCLVMRKEQAMGHGSGMENSWERGSVCLETNQVQPLIGFGDSMYSWDSWAKGGSAFPGSECPILTLPRWQWLATVETSTIVAEFAGCSGYAVCIDPLRYPP